MKNPFTTLRQANALLEERAVLRTLYDHAHAIDHLTNQREQELLALFTDDGVVEVVGPEGATMALRRGRAELAAYFATYPRPPDTHTKHVVCDSIVEVNGTRATASSYWVSITHGPGAPHVLGFGRYDDQLVKRDGRWRIAHRRAEVQASARPG
ncbi:MAG TPA: nuclear transport factor 2 family protein [Acidimicrobiia bacterium]|nr:nuclear transport factor 2 family protein [Acidimicrobiia bacterium]